ncbi:MAG: hypothetical protein GEV08_17115, partial [Acidimicrobiia bacterium]|nr:hypothetical protein [Acidimicrobiia bacterium]
MSRVPASVTHADHLPDDARAGGLGAVVVPIPAGRLADSGLDVDLLGRLGFEAKADQVQVVAPDDGGPLVVAVGLGPDDTLGPTSLRRAAAVAARACKRHGAVAVRLDALGEGLAPRVAAQAVTEGV